MGKLMFGWDDKITCLQPVEVKGANDEQLCLAYKISKLFVGGGVYLKDEGYVLADPARSDTYYPWPPPAKVEQWQQAGLIPKPLPEYSIPAIEYGIAYSLWLIIAGMVAWAQVQRLLTKRRQAQSALIPVSLGPPKVETEGDRFLDTEVKKLLRPGETVQHMAQALKDPEAVGHAYLVALTSQRLLLISTKRKFRGVVLENMGLEEVPRDQLVDCTENAYELTFTLANGRQFPLWVPKGEKEFSNQQAFVRDVPRLLAKEKAVAPVMQVIG